MPSPTTTLEFFSATEEPEETDLPEVPEGTDLPEGTDIPEAPKPGEEFESSEAEI